MHKFLPLALFRRGAKSNGCDLKAASSIGDNLQIAGFPDWLFQQFGHEKNRTFWLELVLLELFNFHSNRSEVIVSGFIFLQSKD